MGKQKKNDLSDVKIKRIDIVPRGGNKRKIFLIKGDHKMPDKFTIEDLQEIEEVLKEETEKETEIEAELSKQKISDAAKSAVKGALRLIWKYKEELPKEAFAALAKIVGYGYPSPEKKQEPKDEKDKSPFTKPYPEVKKSIRAFVLEDKVEDFDKLMKSCEVVDTPITDDPQVLQLMKERKEQAERIEKMERELDMGKYEARIKKELPSLNTTPEKFAPLYMKIEKGLDDSEKKELSELLKAASNQGEKVTQLMKELGTASGGETDTDRQVESRAVEIQKENKGMTIEEAKVKAWDENADTYAKEHQSKT